MEVTLADWRPTKRQVELVNQALKSGRLTYGPMTREFEQKFARLHHRKYAIFTNSGTSALQVSLEYLRTMNKWEDGDEVVVPAVTFVATVNVVLQNRLSPVLVDVDETYNINPDLIEAAITSKTKAILPVHLLGQPAKMDKIMKIAKKHGLRVVEDSCEAMFVGYDGKPVGSWGDVGCFSSYLAHIISTGVGGFITTDSKGAEEYMRSMIWHGRDSLYLSIDANKTVPPNRLLSKRFRFGRMGYSYRLTELEAAMGIDEVDRWRQIIHARQDNARYLTKKILANPVLSEKLILPIVDEKADNAWMFYPIRVRTERERYALALHLEKLNIQTRWIMPLTNQPFYRGWINRKKYPMAEKINQTGILLGIHHFLSKRQLDYLYSGLHAFYA